MRANEVLKAALGHMEDRADTYDKPEGERSMPATVSAFNALTGHQLTAEQGWLFMTVLKLCRTQQGGFRADNYEDGAAYFALMGEQASDDRAYNFVPAFKEGLRRASEMGEISKTAILYPECRDALCEKFGLSPLSQEDAEKIAADVQDPYGPRDAEGWYTWNGDETMRPAGRVECKMRGGNSAFFAAEDAWWDHRRMPSDIVKWRPAQ